MEIKKIVDKGILEKERVLFEFANDDFLGNYAVFRTVKTGKETVSSKPTATFWFPDREVKKGDLVVLYSKVGFRTERQNSDGSTTHFFYWQKARTLWNKPEDTIVLLKISNWSYMSLGG